ncbi:MAG: S9 family peptidase [Myxococcota bacterium]
MPWLSVLAGAALAAGGPTPEGVAGLVKVDEAVIAPDGRAVAWTERHAAPPAEGADDAAWDVATQLWLAREGQPPRQLTFGADVHAPAFSPDGSAIAFLREQDDDDRLFVLPLDGGEARPLDLGDLVPAAFAWAPDGQALAFTAAVPETDEEEAAREARGDAEEVGVFHPDLLWTVPRAGGEPQRLGPDDRHVADLAYAPDGASLALVTWPSGDPYDMLSARIDLLTVADGIVRPLRPEGAVVGHPCFSPDGANVAWTAGRDTLTLNNALWVAPVVSGAPRDLAAKLDLTFDALAWSGDDALVALTTDRTRSKVLRIGLDVAAKPVDAVPERPVLLSLAASADGQRFATLATSPAVPPEPAWFDLDGHAEVVAHPNDLSDWAMGDVEVYAWRGPGGAKLEGVLTLPPGAPKGPLPLMVYPHGGPDGVTREQFDPWTRWFASRGYAVLRPNYRGGTGYGRAFYAANRGKLGKIEFGDIEAGVDALVREGRADKQRLVYGGWSWGGYLTAWTIGHTDRYRAAVAGAAVVDVVSQYALSDINHGRAAQWEFEGDPWRNPGTFERSNPMGSLRRATTPTLILHGRADQRVSFSASMILYRALSDMGTEVSLWAFPDEPHGFTDPRHVAEVLRRWTAWYDAHLAAR